MRLTHAINIQVMFDIKNRGAILQTLHLIVVLCLLSLAHPHIRCIPVTIDPFFMLPLFIQQNMLRGGTSLDGTIDLKRSVFMSTNHRKMMEIKFILDRVDKDVTYFELLGGDADLAPKWIGCDGNPMGRFTDPLCVHPALFGEYIESLCTESVRNVTTFFDDLYPAFRASWIFQKALSNESKKWKFQIDTNTKISNQFSRSGPGKNIDWGNNAYAVLNKSPDSDTLEIRCDITHPALWPALCRSITQGFEFSKQHLVLRCKEAEGDEKLRCKNSWSLFEVYCMIFRKIVSALPNNSDDIKDFFAETQNIAFPFPDPSFLDRHKPENDDRYLERLGEIFNGGKAAPATKVSSETVADLVQNLKSVLPTKVTGTTEDKIKAMFEYSKLTGGVMFWPGIVFDCPVKGYGKCCDICSSNYQPGENNITFANFAKAAGFSFINAQNQGVVDLCISFDDGDISDKELNFFKKMDSAPYVLYSRDASSTPLCCIFLQVCGSGAVRP